MTQQTSHLRGCEGTQANGIDNRTELRRGRPVRPLLLAAALVLVVRGGPGAAARRLLRLLGRLLLQRLLVPASKDPTNRIGKKRVRTNRPRFGRIGDRSSQAKRKGGMESNR